MTVVAVLLIVLGVSVVGGWTVLILTAQVPELGEGDPAIYFHIVAEYLMGAALVSSGVLLLTIGDTTTIRILAGASAGALVYSTINSPGYYARQGNWGAVAVFVGLAVLGIVLVYLLV